ncbi:MAG: BrnA antitoxin family protein [Deltaproteobacteria bacterium]|jgi:uncharacterized protein (DUF4415 family)|nr:BrnA antitoxin family protein [Deltaproteobacteria bacterium]
MKKTNIKEIEALAVKDDKDIDTSDIPESMDWDSAVIGKFYRPIKKKLTIRLDADVVEWFKRNSKHYQSAINKALREHIQSPDG